MKENKQTGKKGGGIAKRARLELEAKTKKKVITKENFLPIDHNKTLPDNDGGNK